MDNKFKSNNSVGFVHSKPEKSEDDYILLADQAEEIKSEAYNAYYFGKSFDEKTRGLRTVLRCHYIKTYCQRMNNSGQPLDYKSFKENWLINGNNKFNAKIKKCL